jgi:hypothetical protein
VLTREQYDAVKRFNNNTNVTVRKADKSNTFVILNTDDYKLQINEILKDEDKFVKINTDSTPQLKKKLRKLIETHNAAPSSCNLPKPVGNYLPGYIYGNPKIHKSTTNPPLRPIISQIGTATYELAKKLNEIIYPYMPKKYMITSTHEFIDLIHSSDQHGFLASLDVESLFTNVPVEDTITIMIDHVFNHPTLSAPDISKVTLRKLLHICTTETPFRNVNGDHYLQKDGVSMGSPLGPLFANFYMSFIEHEALSAMTNRPILYTRYVDDIFLMIDNIATLHELKANLECKSVLKFTYEIEKNRNISFLDVNVSRINNKLQTSVHTKSTNTGECLNYNSITTQQYKLGVIRTFLHRAYKISSNWYHFHIEIDRIKQLLTNNNYPMKIIETEIKRFLQRKYDTPEMPRKTDLKIYYKGQFTSQYKQEEQQLRKIIEDNVTPAAETSTVKLQIYYKARKLANLFIRNNQHPSSSVSNVVYRYTCDNERCQPAQTYIGYTISTLVERMRNHAQQGSIRNHNIEVHNRKITTQEIVSCTKIITRLTTKQELTIAEALLIKEEIPSLNNQREGETRILSIF